MYSHMPNLFTESRIVAAASIAILYAVAHGAPDVPAFLFLLFAYGVASDWVDGRLARYWQCESRLGALLDPVADKCLFYAGFYILLGEVSVAHAFFESILYLVIAYDVITLGLRAANEFGLGVLMRTSELAKWRTGVLQAAFLAFFLTPLVSMNESMRLASLSVALFALGMALSFLAAGGYVRQQFGCSSPRV